MSWVLERKQDFNRWMKGQSNLGRGKGVCSHGGKNELVFVEEELQYLEFRVCMEEPKGLRLAKWVGSDHKGL